MVGQRVQKHVVADREQGQELAQVHATTLMKIIQITIDFRLKFVTRRHVVSKQLFFLISSHDCSFIILSF